ncbi:hypothetical protein C8J57DRAFT_220455 [Mycena rebaudengoi]|nr:hypothetical protein C8J57DRAFT_220455 [Mycena rebaudengoi]
MHSAKGRQTTAFCVLVDTGEFYLGGESSSSHTLAHPAHGQVPQGYNRKSSHISGRPVTVWPASCIALPPGMVLCSVCMLWISRRITTLIVLHVSCATMKFIFWYSTKHTTTPTL